jgi:hypothetical protein
MLSVVVPAHNEEGSVHNKVLLLLAAACFIACPGPVEFIRLRGKVSRVMKHFLIG